MSVDNIWPVISESTIQFMVHAVIESRRFAKISNFHASFLKQAVEVAFLASPERNDCCFIPLTVQSRHDVNCHALGTTGAQQRNDMKHFDLVHERIFVYRFEKALLE